MQSKKGSDIRFVWALQFILAHGGCFHKPFLPLYFPTDSLIHLFIYFFTFFFHFREAKRFLCEAGIVCSVLFSRPKAGPPAKKLNLSQKQLSVLWLLVNRLRDLPFPPRRIAFFLLFNNATYKLRKIYDKAPLRYYKKNSKETLGNRMIPSLVRP